MTLIVRSTAARDIGAMTAGMRARTKARFAAALIRQLALLERFPLLGSELGPSADGSVMFRVMTVGGFQNVVVIFVPLPDGIDVVRVVDGRRDLAAIIAGITP
jgi:plasmid stabilization system protein ParE